MHFGLIGIFAFLLEQFFLTRDFPLFFVIILLIFFFLSHRPSALRKHGKRLLFTPNISPSDGGVHRHQAIGPFLFYDTTKILGAFNCTALNDTILQLPRLSAYALCLYNIALITPVLLPVAVSVFATFGCLNCNFGRLWCSNKAAYVSQLTTLQKKILFA